jgi:creatinine amidohydrolase
MRLADLSWPTVAARAASSLLAVPVGSTEQHGPHLALSTDTDIACCLCDRLAQRRSDVLVAPPIHYGSAGEHAGFAGTLSIGAAVTEELLVELGRSADAFAGVVFVSAHGGNAGPVRAAVTRLCSESRRVRAWMPIPVEGHDAHAGYTETSVLLAVRPQAVEPASAETGCTEPLDSILPVLRTRGVAAVSPNGVLGDPAGASADEGERILSRWSDLLVADLNGWP